MNPDKCFSRWTIDGAGDVVGQFTCCGAESDLSVERRRPLDLDAEYDVLVRRATAVELQRIDAGKSFRYAPRGAALVVVFQIGLIQTFIKKKIQLNSIEVETFIIKNYTF